MGISYLEYLVNPKYRKFPFKGLNGWILANRPPSVEDLQSKYEFRYYSTMNKAVTDVNNGTTANSDAEKGTAVAGVYTDENGGKNVVLLKDHTAAARIQPSVDMTINLGGHVLSTDDLLAIRIATGSITIDGRLRGSGITVIRDGGKTARAIQTASSGITTVIGGTYRAVSTGGYSSTVSCIYINNANGVLNIFDATVLVTSDSPAGTIGIQDNQGTVHISSCDVVAIGNNGTTNGVQVNQSGTIANCDIRAYSDYLVGDDSHYAVSSTGIDNAGTLTINHCNVMGTHSGVTNHGTLTINGGTYEGYGHGGFYFSGTGTTSYVRNAVIRDCDMPDGYTATSQRNGAGFYLGDATNVTVYMDNCDIYGSSATQTFVIKTTDNTLFISNSTINRLSGGMGHIRIDEGNNKLYIGAGNNFTAENTSLPEAVVVTDEVYREVS